MLSTVDRIARVAMICDACVLSKNIRIRDVKGIFIDCNQKYAQPTSGARHIHGPTSDAQ